MSKQISVGNLKIGGGAPVSVQSMTTTKTWDVEGTLRQIEELATAGCDLVRVTLNTPKAVDGFAAFCARSPLPVVADIHYDPTLALAAIHGGAAKIRLNPGNIKPVLKEEIATLCRNKGIPIRLGVNLGSLNPAVEAKYGRTAAAMVYSAIKEAKTFRSLGFDDLCLSVKASDPAVCFEAYKALHEECDYPLHLGVTEAGAGEECLAKSYAVMGGLLLQGIGDTIRVSMTDEPVEEVKAGLNLLRSLGLRRDFVNVIACPMCGRTEHDIRPIYQAVKEAVKDIRTPLTVAVMGCPLNGIGEAKDADLGVAMSANGGVLFAKGKQLGMVSHEEILPQLLALIEEGVNG